MGALGRYVLTISAAAALLAGCGGAQPPMGAPRAMPYGQSVMTARAISRHSGTASPYRRLYSFANGSDGQQPGSSLVNVNGTLYGTTYGGGKYHGNGTVFSISTSGAEHVVHSFGHDTDGAHPAASLIDVKGTLYGTTTEGGKYNAGTFFSISISGTEHVLHSFSNLDGVRPEASPIDVKGTLYGTTAEGGRYTYGTVYSASTTGVVKVFHSFGRSTDGIFPEASLIDVNGTLFGTTGQGGKYHGNGTVFSITTSGAEHVLHSFGHDMDGALPAASLIDVNGVLYGTTPYGGKYGTSSGTGTVFSITTSGAEHVLHSFGHPYDGSDPAASLIDVNGVLYGTTFYGGTHGEGTVFALKP